MKLTRKQRRIFTTFSAIMLIACCAANALAAGDSPLDAMNNLSTFLFGLIKSIGMIILAFGIVQVGLSLKSHDPSQRANGMLTVAGGVVIAFAKESASVSSR